jgi:aldose 1-epimerase
MEEPHQRIDDITLELDQLKLVVNPGLGCSIMSLMIRNDHDQWAHVLRSMPGGDQAGASDSGSFVMLPWTNRIRDARFSFEKQSIELRSNFPDSTAIHGVGRDLPWTITDRSPISARFILDSRTFDNGEVNYPFSFGATQRFEIGPQSVEIDLSITNLDDRPIPVGCGHHPYFHRHLFSDADDLRLKLGVTGRYPSTDCIPDGESVHDEVCASLGELSVIGNPGLDDVFSGFDGTAEFDWAASNIKMTMECSANMNHVVIYTPRDAEGEADEFICVEPVTMVNDGFNRMVDGKADTGVTVLEPNETLRTRMKFRFH